MTISRSTMQLPSMGNTSNSPLTTRWPTTLPTRNSHTSLGPTHTSIIHRNSWKQQPFIRHPSRPPFDSQLPMRRSQSTGREPADLHQGHTPPATLPVLRHRPSQHHLKRPCICTAIQFRTSWHCVTRWTFSSQLCDPCVTVARNADRAPGVMANALHVGAPGTRSTSLISVRLSPLCANTTSFSISVEEMPARNPRQINSFEHYVSLLSALLAWVGVNKPGDTFSKDDPSLWFTDFCETTCSDKTKLPTQACPKSAPRFNFSLVLGYLIFGLSPCRNAPGVDPCPLCCQCNAMFCSFLASTHCPSRSTTSLNTGMMRNSLR